MYVLLSLPSVDGSKNIKIYHRASSILPSMFSPASSFRRGFANFNHEVSVSSDISNTLISLAWSLLVNATVVDWDKVVYLLSLRPPGYNGQRLLHTSPHYCMCPALWWVSRLHSPVLYAHYDPENIVDLLLQSSTAETRVLLVETPPFVPLSIPIFL